MTLWKALVMALALANVGYFLWLHGIAGSEDIPAMAKPGGWAPALKLASEKPEAPRPNRIDVAAATAAGGDFAELGRAPEAPSEAPSPGLAGGERCLSIGPFRNAAQAATAASILNRGSYEPRQRISDGEVWAGVWLYLPAPAAQAARDDMLAKLKAGGFDNAVQMQGPDDSPVVSLGLYSDSKRAQSRIAQAHALGLRPAVADHRRNGNVYWIDIDLKPTDSVPNLAELQSGAAGAARLEVNGCPAPSQLK